MLSFKDRRRLKAKEAIRLAAVPKKRLWQSFTYSGVISTIALLATCVTAYYNIFYVHRSLTAVIGPFDTPMFYGEDGIALHPVLSNTGNRTEVILKVNIHVYRAACAQLYWGGSAGPFVLKAGDSVVASVAFDAGKLGSSFDLAGLLYLSITSILPNGRVSIVDVPIVQLNLKRKGPTEPMVIGPTDRVAGPNEIIDLFGTKWPPPCPQLMPV